MTSTTIAIVDVGTNTTRLYVADVEDGRIAHTHVRVSRVTRLGAGVDHSGRLADDALAREHAVLADYRDTIAHLRPDRAIAVMTSAVRDADNGPEFAEAVARSYRLDVHVLSGAEEARLTYRGATDELTDSADAVLVIDIGGGSTELVIGHGPDPEFNVSTQAGVVRQADRHIENDPPTSDELDALAADVRSVLAAAVPTDRRAGVQRALAVAGTPTALAAIAQSLDPYDAAKVHGYRLNAATVADMLGQLVQLPLESRRHVPGMHPERAVTILPGIVILQQVMSLFGLDEIEVSEHDILRGAALTFADA